MGDEEDEENWENKTRAKIDNPNRDFELNGELGMVEYDDNSKNYKE